MSAARSIPTAALDASPALGPGWLVLVVGPSGAGKDTLIAEARRALDDRPGIHFPARVITRPPDATERSVATSEAAFEADCAQGRYALHWRAHGLGYGVVAEIDDLIRGGDTVVVNVSRSVIPQARTRYVRTCVVLVDADPALRAQRLTSRGRESPGALAERFAREAALSPALSPDLTIINDGAPADGGRRLAEALGNLCGG